MKTSIGRFLGLLAPAALSVVFGLLLLLPSQQLAAEAADGTLYLPLVLTSPPPLSSLQFAFLSDRDGAFQIYSIQADGSNPQRLTNTAWYKGAPTWAPDGTHIAFPANPNTPTMNWDIYSIQSDGSALRNLTNNPASDGNPAWSPDGEQIAFESDRDGNSEIYVMDADGANPVNLTNNPARDTEAAWSPDGTQLAFISDRTGAPGLFVMAANGALPTRLDDAASSYRPAWSPDGQRLAYANNSNISVLALSAPTPVQLTHFTTGTLSVVGFPAWSPDGAQLVFIHVMNLLPSATPTVYVILADGSEAAPRALGYGGYPAWSPDGNYISYNTRNYPAGVTAQIHVTRWVDRNDLQVTTGANNYAAVWRPLAAARQ